VATAAALVVAPAAQVATAAALVAVPAALVVTAAAQVVVPAAVAAAAVADATQRKLSDYGRSAFSVFRVEMLCVGWEFMDASLSLTSGSRFRKS
jgi:hypothetical protein